MIHQHVEEMALLGKDSVLASIFKMKCPKCHEGDLFTTGSFAFNKPFDMPEKCPYCGQEFLPEPGFYYGAMFISYILTGWLFLAVVATFIWGFGMSVNNAFIALIAFAAIFFIYFFRISRSIWIHIIIKFDKKAADRARIAKNG